MGEAAAWGEPVGLVEAEGTAALQPAKTAAIKAREANLTEVVTKLIPFFASLMTVLVGLEPELGLL